MNLKNKSDKRNYIIIALCLILVIMGIGYAAFSQLLTINGTANISNSWCLGFDNSKTSTYEISKGISIGEAPTGTMTYSGDVCSTNLVPHSNLTAVFHQPGDQIEYTLTIKNASSVTAAIKSIKVDTETITGNKIKTKGNITFIVNFPEKTTLSPNEETTMTVIAKFQNENNITGTYSGESQSINIELNGVQDDGNGGIVPVPSTFTGTIYRNNLNKVAIGDSIAPATKNVWCAVNQNENRSTCTDENHGMNTEEDCLAYIEGWDGATCELGTITTEGVGDYVTNASNLNKNYYIKHDVVNDIVTASYACFVTDKEYCLKGGIDECQWDNEINDGNGACSSSSTPVYNENKLLLQGQNTWFNNNSGSCSFEEDGSECETSPLSAYAYLNGYVTTSSDAASCMVNSHNSYCDSFIQVDPSQPNPINPNPGGEETAH